MKKYRFECWNVAFRKHDNNVLFDNAPSFTVIKNPILFWAADPFIIFDNDKYYIFAELYNRLTHKGQIKYLIMSKNGTIKSHWKKALKVGKHLSFPYIYRENNSYFMMPESSKNKDLIIYKADEFPFKWSQFKVLLDDVRFADSIFIEKNHILTYDNYSRPRQMVLLSFDGLKWNNSSSIEDSNIFYRPGGKSFLLDNNLIVPFQDSSSGEYGGRIHFASIKLDVNTIVVSNDLASIEPDSISLNGFKAKKIYGIHTYNYDGNFEVIDIKTYSFNLFSFIGYVFLKLFGKK